MKNMFTIWEENKNIHIKGHVNYMNHHNFDWLEIAGNIEKDNRFNNGFRIWDNGK